MFKICSKCGKQFRNRAEFLNGQEIELIGCMSDFDDPEKGVLLFNHTCMTTLSVSVDAFLDLYSGPRYEEPKTLKEYCPEYCFDVRNTGPCQQACRYQFVRILMQILKAELSNSASQLEPDQSCA